MAELSVQLTANIRALESALKKVKKDLTDTGEVAERSAKKINNSTSKVASTGMNTLKSSTAGASNTLLEFNRVVQDAPFGIRGVANNIQQLVANFGYLSKNAGGTSAAFRALLSSFIGPAGILFAVSAVTSLLTVYGDKLFRTTNLTKELTKATQDFGGNAIKEITVLKQLLTIAGDETESREKRNQAVQILQDKYPKYLKNLDAENTTTKEIKKSVDALTKSLEIRAKVQGAEALIAEKAKELFLAQTKAQENFDKQIKDIPRRLADQATAYRQYAKGVGGTQFDLQKNEEVLQNKAQERLKDTLSEAESEYQKYVSRLTGILAGAPDLLDVFGISNKGGKNKVGSPLRVDPVPKGLDAIFKVTQGIGPAIIKPITLAAKQVKPALANIELALIQFNDRAKEIVDFGIGETFAGIGEAIGSALATGANVLESVSKSLLSTLGGILIELGKMAISIGVGLLGIKAALKTLNPVAAIAAGTALIALGSVFKNATGGLANRFGGGGGASVGGQGGFGSVGGGNFGVSGGGTQTVVFEIAGTKLLGVLKNTIDRNQRLGGSVILS